MFSLTDYNYDLPEKQIAQKPSEKRDQSKLLYLDRQTGKLSHHHFYEIYDLLSPSDVLVINNTEVIPGRLVGKKDTGGKAELLILNYGEKHPLVSKDLEGFQNLQGLLKQEFICNCLIKTSKPPKADTKIFFDQNLEAEVIDCQNGIYTVKFFYCNDFENLLYEIGKIPLPPYIKRESGNTEACDDKTAYQTVYASQKGAIAAPTAGLHFSDKLIEKIKSKSVRIAAITLHVGYGTFLPVRVSDIREHKMHTEWYSIPETSATVINDAKAAGRRVVAVGTTCVRTLEYASDENGKVLSGTGHCNLFIYPGYRFKAADAMITNFHLPKSTLLMLVSAFAGRENILNAYKTAIDKDYRFYSYGDAMFIA